MQSTINKSKEKLRQKAEKLLTSKHNTATNQISEGEALRLIHEMEVHQIELELQNEELILAKEQAETASQKYTELYDFAPTGYFTLTYNAEIIDLNLLGAKMLGKERSQLQNGHFGMYVSNDSKAVFNSFIEKVFESFSTENCELTLSTKDNSEYCVYLTGIAKENEKHCLVTAIDITPRKQIESELLLAKESAEESDRLKTAFLQNMSHEIRTPLTAIKGFSELLIMNHSDEAQLQKFTKIINQRCDDLIEIINDILDIAKIESGQLPVYMEEFKLPDLLNELAAQFTEYQKRNKKEHISFSLKTLCTPSDSFIISDRGKLKQIFINLITNAFKFTNEGSIEGGCKIENNKLVFFISDTGIGIPFNKQKEVFERFAQLRQVENRTVGGTGLGLSITLGLVNLLGGQIFLDSEPGKGSTFSFTIPYKRAQSFSEEPMLAEDTKERKFTDKTILLVEDDIYIAEYIKVVLKTTGVNILLAETGSQSIQIAASKPVDLVLMDINLPDMDGYDASRQIRLYKPNMNIIAQTAYAAESDKIKALEAGFNNYLSKPIEVDLLLSLVTKYLSNN